MKYTVKRKDITGAIEGYPIEIIQTAVDRGVENGGDAELVIRGLQFSTSSGFSWAATPEGIEFWSRIMCERKFNIFFQRYPREFVDGVYYFVVDRSRRYWIDVAKTFLGEQPRFAFKGNDGDLFYIFKHGSNSITGFALKDSPRYRWVVENGTKIKY